MSPPGQQTTPHYVKAACEHCVGGIEFDSNQLANGETCLVQCPHCHMDTIIFVSEEDEPLPVNRHVQPRVSTARPHYVTVACEHCDRGIEFDANQLADDETRVVQCPHCHLETTLFVPEEGKSTPSTPNYELRPWPNRVQSSPNDEFAPGPPPLLTCIPIAPNPKPSLPPILAVPGGYRATEIGNSEHAPIHTAHDAEWVPPGVDAWVEGFRIPGGMVYLGKRLACVYGGGVEPSLINPVQPIQLSEADCHIGRMGYWPSYHAISPEARASYLQWLATGKCDPEADLGYVFLYFYGLERRVLWDAARDSQARGEIPSIERELQRLMEIYSQSGSFRGYAGSLLEYMAAAKGVWPVLEAGVPPKGTGNRGLNFHLRLGLGLLSKSRRPLPVDWALAWLYSDPTVRLRKAASRCAGIFVRLFEAEYARGFGEGLELPENKTRLKITHRPASGSFSFQPYTLELDLPDVTVMSAPVSKLLEVAEMCTDRLHAYSRFISRNPDQAHTFDALLLLPPDTWPAPVQEALKALCTRASESRGMLSLSDLQGVFPQPIVMTKSKFTSLSRALGCLSIGIEPDARFGGHFPGIGDPIVLFPCEGLGEDQPLSQDFASGALLLHLAAAVAGSDGELGAAEEALLLQHIQHGLNVAPSERQRLAARLQLYKSNHPA